MYSQDMPLRSKSQGRQFSDEEWERVKEPFRRCYMEEGMSLKKAAEFMRDNYDFDATQRQWERKLAPEKWNFTKYTAKHERFEQIQRSGRTLLEVSTSGRRKSTASDGRPTVVEDRNIRRFARREISRERKRARSVNSSADHSDNDMSDRSAASSPMPGFRPLPTMSQGLITTPHGYMPLNDFPVLQPSFSEPEVSPSQHYIPQHHRASMPLLRVNQMPLPGAELDLSDDLQTMSPIEYTEATAYGFQRHSTAEPFPGLDLDHDVDSQISNMHEHDALASASTRCDQSLPFGAQAMLDSFPNVSLSNESMNVPAFALNDSLVDMQDTDVTDYMTFNQPQERLAVQQAADDDDQLLPSDYSIGMQDINVEDEDYTYRDVHIAVQNHFELTMSMVNACISACQNMSDRNTMIQTLQTLRPRLEMQNRQDDQNIRGALKRVSAIERSATQNIKNSYRRKFEQLEAELAALTMSTPIANVSFPYS